MTELVHPLSCNSVLSTTDFSLCVTGVQVTLYSSGTYALTCVNLASYVGTKTG